MQDDPNATDDKSDTGRKTDWAEARTDWAEDRTVLANERTFAGWMRTGMAAIAIAVGLRAVFDAAEPGWLPKLVSTVFIGASLLIFWSAWRNSSRGQNRLDTHEAQEQGTRIFAILAAVFSLGALAVGAILWTL